MIYLDHAATTPVPRAVADTMYTVLTEHFGNPSAQYPMGLETKKQVELWQPDGGPRPLAVRAGSCFSPPAARRGTTGPSRLPAGRTACTDCP